MEAIISEKRSVQEINMRQRAGVLKNAIMRDRTV